MRLGQFSIIVGFLVLSSSLFAQDLDSLKLLLNSTHTGVERISLLKQIGEGYLNKRDTSAIQYFNELLELSQFSDDPALRAYAYYKMGVSRFHQNDVSGSSDLYFKGLEFTTEADEFNEIKAKLYNAIGWNLELLSKYESALKYFRMAESCVRSGENLQLAALILNNKGVVYKNVRFYDSALSSFNQSLAINRKINSDRQIRFNLNNIGTVLCQLKRFAEAKSYVREALALNSAAEDTVEIINNLLNLSFINIAENELVEASTQLESALSMATRGNYLEQQRRVYNSMMTIAERRGDYRKAFQYQDIFGRLTDSLYRRGNVERVQEIEARYNTLAKDLDLQKARRNAVEQRFYMTLFMGGFLVTIVVIFFLWRSIRIKRTNEKILMKLNEEIRFQAEELRLANEEITVTNENLELLVQNRTEIIQAQNKRLIQFAFMNSHKIRGPLATMMGLVTMLYRKQTPEEAKEIVDHLMATANKMDEIVREVSRELEKEDQL